MARGDALLCCYVVMLMRWLRSQRRYNLLLPPLATSQACKNQSLRCYDMLQLRYVVEARRYEALLRSNVTLQLRFLTLLRSNGVLLHNNEPLLRSNGSLQCMFGMVASVYPTSHACYVRPRVVCSSSPVDIASLLACNVRKRRRNASQQFYSIRKQRSNAPLLHCNESLLH